MHIKYIDDICKTIVITEKIMIFFLIYFFLCKRPLFTWENYIFIRKVIDKDG
jgi:hypothetical protein